MEITKELKDAKEKQRQNVEQLNQLRQEFQQQEQQLLQEILRLDGELRLLARLSNDGQRGTD